jgi:hypothetical protein
MAFDSTISGGSSNSYISVAEADAYFEFHPDVNTWLNLTDADKELYLVTATNRLEQLSYGGKPTNSSTQRLQWPREFIRNRAYEYLDEGFAIDLYFESSQSQYYYPKTIMPKDFIVATCLLALHYFNKFTEVYDLTDLQYETYSDLKVGGVSLTLREGLTDDRLPTYVKRTLRSIGPDAWNNATNRKLVRG